MRAAVVLVIQIACAALVAASAGAQGPSNTASTRVTVVVPERGASRVGSGSAAGASLRARGARPEPEASGRSDASLCAATLDLGVIGRASVSCLETVDPGMPSPGVAIELESSVPGGAQDAPLLVELTLDDGAVVRLAARPYRRAGRDIQRVTAPSAAVRRIAASRRVTLRVSGRSHALSGGALDALRLLALRLEP